MNSKIYRLLPTPRAPNNCRLVVVIIITSMKVENQLVIPPCHNIPRFKLLKFGDSLTICAHFCEVCTIYNQVGANEKDFVDTKYQHPRANKKLKISST